MSRMSSKLPILLLASGLAGCGDRPTLPDHQRLAQGFLPPPIGELGQLDWHGHPVSLASDADGTRFSVSLDAKSWASLGQGVWRAARPFGGLAHGTDSTLVGGGGPLHQPRLKAKEHQQVALQGLACSAGDDQEAASLPACRAMGVPAPGCDGLRSALTCSE